MRIVEQTANKLVLRDRLTALIFWPIGGLFTLAALAVIILLPTGVELNCRPDSQATRDRCEIIETQGLFGILYKKVRRTASVRAAAVEVERAANGIDEHFRVLLTTESGRVPLLPYFSADRNEKQRTADEINRAIAQSGNQGFSVRMGEMWSESRYFYWSLFALGGLYVVFSVKFLDWTFDRIQGIIFVRRVGLLGTEVEQYPLGELTGVRVENGGTGIQSRQYTSRVVLLFGPRRIVPVNAVYTSSRNDKQRLAEQIQRFVGLS